MDTAGNASRDDDRKLFVGGLSYDTTEQDLRNHFGQYGEIDRVNVKTDPQTGRSRCFAFIIFQSPDSIEKVVAFEDHTINGKKVDPKKAKARQGKIFVGGLSPETSDEEIKAFFEQFGNVVDIQMPFDKLRNQRKGFCFVTYDSEAVVTELLKNPKQMVGGKEVDVKRATAKPDMGHGAFGGPRANYQGFGGGGYYQGGFGREFTPGYGGGGAFSGGSGGGGGWGYDYDYTGHDSAGYQRGNQRGRQYQGQY